MPTVEMGLFFICALVFAGVTRTPVAIATGAGLYGTCGSFVDTVFSDFLVPIAHCTLRSLT